MWLSQRIATGRASEKIVQTFNKAAGQFSSFAKHRAFPSTNANALHGRDLKLVTFRLSLWAEYRIQTM